MAAQKPFTASGRGNQPAGEDPESNICCLGFHDIRVITTLAVNSRDFVIMFASLMHKREQ